MQHLINLTANFDGDTFGWRSRAAANIKIKRNKKRRALIGKQRVELLINNAGKRTVVVLNPSFFTSLIPSSLSATVGLHYIFKYYR